jgi:hypothetical protein
MAEAKTLKRRVVHTVQRDTSGQPRRTAVGGRVMGTDLLTLRVDLN